MNLIDIWHHDYLAECAKGINFENWFQYGWENHVLSFHLQRKKDDVSKIKVSKNTCFNIGSYLVKLYDSYFEEEPDTEYIPPASGELTTLFMQTTIRIKTGKIKGKIKIYSVDQPTVSSDYELSVKNTDIKMTVGMSISGESLNYNHCIYDSSTVNLTFLYNNESQKVSVFDKTTDSNTKTLLAVYIFQYFIKDLGPAIEDFQVSRLAIKQTVSELCGQATHLKHLLQLHNIKLHHGFNMLAKKIVHLTNTLIDQTSLSLSKLYGLAEKTNGHKVFEVYQGTISSLNSLVMKENKDVLVSKENDNSVKIYIPLEFEKIKLEYKNLDQTNGSDGIDETHIYSINDVLIILKIIKLNEKKVEFNVEKIRIMDFSPWSKYRIEMAMDYSVSSAVADSLMPHLTQALKDDCLHKLTLYPDVEHFNYQNFIDSSDSVDSSEEEYFGTEENQEETRDNDMIVDLNFY